MWINLKPYIEQAHSPIATPYTIGISSSKDFIDQKRNLVKLKPGYRNSIKVLVHQLVSTSTEFDEQEINVRRCKLPQEADTFKFLQSYTRTGCEFECAAKKALHFCKCQPWYYPNNFTGTPICDMFGGNCFDKIMSNETNYKHCSANCLEDCHETSSMTILTNIFPLDIDDLCKEGNSFHQYFMKTYKQHFAFQSYKTLVDGKCLPDLAMSLSNGSLCKDYVAKYVAFVGIDSPSRSVMSLKRDKKYSFNDKLGTIGGTLGLILGVSLTSIVEVLFLVIDLIVSGYNQIRGKVKGKDKTSQSERIKQVLSNSNSTKDLVQQNRIDIVNQREQIMKLNVRPNVIIFCVQSVSQLLAYPTFYQFQDLTEYLIKLVKKLLEAPNPFQIPKEEIEGAENFVYSSLEISTPTEMDSSPIENCLEPLSDQQNQIFQNQADIQCNKNLLQNVHVCIIYYTYGLLIASFMKIVFS